MVALSSKLYCKSPFEKLSKIVLAFIADFVATTPPTLSLTLTSNSNVISLEFCMGKPLVQGDPSRMALQMIVKMEHFLFSFCLLWGKVQHTKIFALKYGVIKVCLDLASLFGARRDTFMWNLCLRSV